MASSKVPISDYFQAEELGYLPDILLQKVSWKLLPSDYMKLGTYLGVRMSDMGYLRCERTCFTQALEMYTLWYRKNKHNKWSKLADALETSGRMDLIQESRIFMNTYQVMEGFDDFKYSWIADRFFSMLADKCPKDWYDVGINLGLSLAELAGIRQPIPSDRTISNPVFEVLKAWKHNRTSSPKNLITVLEEDMGRCDKALYVEGLYAGVPTCIKLTGSTEPIVTLV